MEEKKDIFQNKKLLLIVPVLLVIAVIGVTYAFFNYTRTGGGNTISTGSIYFNSEQEGSISVSNFFPTDSNNATHGSNSSQMTVTITAGTSYEYGIDYSLTAVNVTRPTGTTTNIPVRVVATIENNTIGFTPAAAHVITDTNNFSLGEGHIAPTNSQNSTNDGGLPAQRVTGVITVTAYIDASDVAITDTPEESSPWQGTRTVVVDTTEWNRLAEMPVTFQVRVVADEGEEPTLYNKVKAKSLGTMNAASDFKVLASNDTTNHPYGVYQLNESGLESPIYFYRGDHTVKNNVIFDSKCWLVVRTTETNSVRILYNGTPVDGHCTTTEGDDTMISLYQSDEVNSDGNYDYSYESKTGFTTLKSGTNFAYNVNYTNAKYVGYTYDNGVSSNMKNALEAWYEGAISSTAKAKIETSTYCNDIRVDESETSYTKYMPMTRAFAKTPSVLCPTGANAISGKVGFLTVDEETLAGRTTGGGMQDYLYNGEIWWLGSPRYFISGNASVFLVAYDNSASSSRKVNIDNGLRPVVSIKSNTLVTDGDGSQDTPWIIG